MNLSEVKISGVRSEVPRFRKRATEEEKAAAKIAYKEDREMIQAIGLNLGKALGIKVFNIDRPPFTTTYGDKVDDNNNIVIYVPKDKAEEFVKGVKEFGGVQYGEDNEDPRYINFTRVQLTGKYKKAPLTVSKKAPIARVDEEEANNQLEHHLAAVAAESEEA